MTNSHTLDIQLTSDCEITMTRQFDAPRELVFEASTKPEYLKRWLLGPPGWTMPVCEVDLRPGGAWHFVWRKSNGEEMSMRGLYTEVEPPSRLVTTESWGPEWPETTNTQVFTEANGKTTLTLTILYPSKADRDAAAATGMKDGASSSYDRLEEVVEGMAARA